MTSPIGSDIHLTLAVWAPGSDPIVAYELSRSGLLPEGWVKATCSAAAGVGVRFVHSLSRSGAICSIRKPADSIDSWVVRWEQRFDQAWVEKAAVARLPDWKAIVVYGLEDRSKSSVARHSWLSNAVDQGAFDSLEQRLTQFNWKQVGEHTGLSEA